MTYTITKVEIDKGSNGIHYRPYKIVSSYYLNKGLYVVMYLPFSPTNSVLCFALTKCANSDNWKKVNTTNALKYRIESFTDEDYEKIQENKT